MALPPEKPRPELVKRAPPAPAVPAAPRSWAGTGPRRDDTSEVPVGVELARLVRDAQDVLEQLKGSLPPAPASVPPSAPTQATEAPASRPSLPVRASLAAGTYTWRGVKVLTIAAGLIGIASQLARWLGKHEVVGPLQDAAELLRLLGGRL